jgi:hypothetical protein
VSFKRQRDSIQPLSPRCELPAVPGTTVAVARVLRSHRTSGGRLSVNVRPADTGQRPEGSAQVMSATPRPAQACVQGRQRDDWIPVMTCWQYAQLIVTMDERTSGKDARKVVLQGPGQGPAEDYSDSKQTVGNYRTGLVPTVGN